MRNATLVFFFLALIEWMQCASAMNCTAAALSYPIVFGANITSLTARKYVNHNNITGADFCEVNVTLTHSGTGDNVLNVVWLPMNAWNGRFQGSSGGGFLTGIIELMESAMLANYSTAITDGGHSLSLAEVFDNSAWALASEGNVNEYLLRNFASRSIHDMTVIGKAITEDFYKKPISKSYWNGCSTGGRQGLVEAQMYPNDYDGILAIAPAIYWNPFTMAQQWPYVVLKNEPNKLDACDFDFVVEESVKACDGIDGVMDGVVSAPGICSERFTPYQLVNQTYSCGDESSPRQWSTSSAAIIQKIWAGPVDSKGASMWYGLGPAANLTTLVTFDKNTSAPEPFGISNKWIQNNLYKIDKYDTANITYQEYERLNKQSAMEYDSVIGSANPDLSAFKASGGKMLTWHGLSDDIIFYNATERYYKEVAALDPNVADFYRLFMAPGVGHCQGGSGPFPVGALDIIVNWVENGVAPETLPAKSAATSNGTYHQNLCQYPKVSKYSGNGDPRDAKNFECADSY